MLLDLCPEFSSIRETSPKRTSMDVSLSVNEDIVDKMMSNIWSCVEILVFDLFLGVFLTFLVVSYFLFFTRAFTLLHLLPTGRSCSTPHFLHSDTFPELPSVLGIQVRAIIRINYFTVTHLKSREIE